MRTATGQRSQDHPSIDSLSKNNIGLEHQLGSFWCLRNTHTFKKKCISVQLAIKQVLYCAKITLQLLSDLGFPRDSELPKVRNIHLSLVLTDDALF